MNFIRCFVGGIGGVDCLLEFKASYLSVLCVVLLL